MYRAIPSAARGPLRHATPQRIALACPRVCPEWQLAALRALIKPQFKDAIRHRSSKQPWTRERQVTIAAAMRSVEAIFGGGIQSHFPRLGDFHFIAAFERDDAELAKTAAVLVSKQAPALWFTLGRWYVRDGKFFRRHRSRNRLLQPAASVHLTRAHRRELRRAMRNETVVGVVEAKTRR